MGKSRNGLLIYRLLTCHAEELGVCNLCSSIGHLGMDGEK